MRTQGWHITLACNEPTALRNDLDVIGDFITIAGTISNIKPGPSNFLARQLNIGYVSGTHYHLFEKHWECQLSPEWRRSVTTLQFGIHGRSLRTRASFWQRAAYNFMYVPVPTAAVKKPPKPQTDK